MIPRYAALARLAQDEVPWPEGPFPLKAFLDACRGAAVAFIVSPNNPTGAVATPAQVREVARANPGTLVVLDAAYGELAEDDPTRGVLGEPNVVVMRTLSKAWGLAGLRVGCALGRSGWLRRLEAAGSPYPVSAASAAIALERLRTGADDVARYAAEVRVERGRLALEFEQLGSRPARPAEGNFVLARGLDAGWLRDAAASLGIALRSFPGRPDLADAVRVTVPGEARVFEALVATLRTCLAPQALLLDLDGVVADVSGSYRRAILETAQSFGVRVTGADIERIKAAGDANDDWRVTQRLLRQAGVEVPLDVVTDRFEALYQGSPGQPGLELEETPCVTSEVLEAWRGARPLALVTGRPRRDAERFLERFGLADLFDTVVAREDAALKPDPAPVRLALEQLGVERAWMVGDTPDDLVAARGAGVVPIGVVPPGADPSRTRTALEAAGAARVLSRTEDLTALLP
jgi:HAD superfamily hydrolase (TIGR01548 family)